MKVMPQSFLYKSLKYRLQNDADQCTQCCERYINDEIWLKSQSFLFWISSILWLPSQNGLLLVCLQLHSQYFPSSSTSNTSGNNADVCCPKFLFTILWVPSHSGWNKNKKQTNNYLPWNSSDQDYLPSCTSSGCILQLWKVPSVLVHLLSRSCT